MKITNKIWLGVIIAAILLLIISIVYYALSRPGEEEKAPTSVRVVMEGDEIEWEYTAYIGGKEGTVFDTNVEDVRGDPLISKASMFPGFPHWEARYIVGNNPGGEEFPTMDENIKGHKEGEKFHFTIPASNGIAYLEERRVEIPATEEIPMYERMSVEDFEIMYPEERAFPGTTMTHPLWKWEVRIEHMDSDNNMTLVHLPNVGFRIDSLPWASVVEEVSSEKGVIVLEHDTSDRSMMDESVDSLDLMYYNEQFGKLAMEALAGRITEMNADRIVVDFNDERAGEDLYLEVTVTKIIE